jgi:non-specific protein-tyrosine kinase
MNYFRMLALAWRWSWLLVLGMAVGAGGAYVASRMQDKVYESTATVLVNQAREGPTLTYNDVLANQQLAKTYTSLVRRRPVLAKAEQNLNLPAGALNGAVQSTLPRDTQLIEITAQANSAELAADIANEVAKVFSNQIQVSQAEDQTTAARKLDEQIAALQGSLRTAPTAEASVIQSALEGLEKQRQDVRAGLVNSFASVTIAEQAQEPAAPIKPRVMLNTLLGAALGLIVAAAIVALFEYLDDTVKTPEDVRQVMGASPLGIIARYSAGRGRTGALITGLDGRSQAIESYRMLRTNLDFSQSGDVAGRAVLITSCKRGEGKTTTAANLAIALAQTGRRVVLIDADMRNPSLHGLFNADNAMGLSVLLHAEQAAIDPAQDLQLVSDNLSLLPCGPIPPNPAELLASRRFEYVVNQLRRDVDFIIVDSPPLLEVTDASAVAARVNGTILVAEAYRTRKRDLRQALQTLSQVNATVLGMVLNKMRVPRNHSPLLYSSGPFQAGGKWEAGRSEQSPANL